ncbi:unnamed protein product [Caenorhabditis angaria]|uniref:Uncharacterized protein n=1 Tax=Caenorhabditis angaria TaxID=860376 RepID=A0A9P1N503_9PELO|nr:unnamed protein product [Caenorhabditis angaria]
MSDWTVEQVVKCVNIVLREGIVPQLSTSELEEFENPEILDEPRLNKLLNILFKKSERIKEFYDRFDDFKLDLEKIREIPELYRYGYDKPGNIKYFQASGEAVMFVNEKDQRIVSKNDITMMFFNAFDNANLNVITRTFYNFWIDCFVQQIYRKLNNSYELVLHSVGSSIEYAVQHTNITRDVNLIIREKDFYELRKYFGDRKAVVDHIMTTQFKEILDTYPIHQNQQLYRKSYMDIVGCIETSLKVHKDFIEVFEPFTKPSKYRLPTVRCFWIPDASHEVHEKVYFVKEVLDCMKMLRENSNIEIVIESEEERKLGVVHLMSEKEFQEILKTYQISRSEISIMNLATNLTSFLTTIPFISIYGTFVKLATDAMQDVIFHTVQNMQLYENIKQSDFPKVIKWIEVNLKDFFFVSDKLYAIEVWRIDEMIEKARNELQKYKSNVPMFEIPQKSSYEKKEVMEYIQKMMKPLKFDKLNFEVQYEFRDEKTKNSRNGILKLYKACVQIEVMNQVEYIKLAYDKQVYDKNIGLEKFIKKSPESPVKVAIAQSSAPKPNNEFAAMKKGFLNPKKTDIFEEVARKISEISFKTLAYFSNTEFQPISEFEKLLEKPDFCQVFNEKNFEYLKNTIFKNKEKTKKLMKKLEDLFEIEENDEKLMIKKRTSYKVDPMKMKIIEEIEENEKKKIEIEKENEKEKMMENMKVENLEMKKNIEELRKQLENIKNEAENERKIFHEEISLKNGENLKIAENLENSKKELKQVRKELKETRGTYSKIVEENQKEIGNLKKETRKMKENQENEKKKYEKEMKLKEKENMEISGKLQRLEENSEKLNSKIKSLEKDLRNAKNSAKIEMENNLKVIERNMNEAETSKKYLENEKENMKKRLKQLLDEKVEENGKIEELSKENKKLREKLANNSEKMKKFEDWKYERILKIDYETIIDEISSKLNELIRKFPENSEFLCARNEIEEFDENLENYMENIREEIRKIERNLEGEYEENEDIQEFPNQEFMQKYQKWVEEYL